MSKYFDARSIAQIISEGDATGGEIQPTALCTGCISAPSEGDDETNRDGRQIVISQIEVHGHVWCPARTSATVLLPPALHFYLVLDTHANGATIVSEQVFAAAGANDVAGVGYMRNMDYISRYIVLDDACFILKHITMAVNATDASQACPGQDFILKWNGQLQVTFKGTTADVANVTDNAVHVLGFSTTTTFEPTCTFVSRVRFHG